MLFDILLDVHSDGRITQKHTEKKGGKNLGLRGKSITFVKDYIYNP